MKRHAYLIMAHNQEKLLTFLLQKLDVEENDIYVHLDKKCDISSDQFHSIVNKANLFFVEQINVEWGGYSQIRAIMIMLKEALKTHHIYYHMLAGVDLPLKKVSDINNFYNQNEGKEFIRFFSEEKAREEYDRRFGYKNIFKDKFGRTTNIWKFINKFIYCLQKVLNIYDKRLIDSYYIGASSWDITEELAKEIVNHEDDIKKTYKWTSCPDESFVQMFIYGTKYWDRLWVPYSKEGNGMEANMRYIDFSHEKNGSPHTIRAEDIDYLVSSGLNFARKFDLRYGDAIDILEEKLK